MTVEEIQNGFRSVYRKGNENFPDLYWVERWESKDFPGYRIVQTWNDIGTKEIALQYNDEMIKAWPWLTTALATVIQAIIYHKSYMARK